MSEFSQPLVPQDLSDEQLVAALKGLIVRERTITAEIVGLMREVEARRLYLDCGYSSLFEFCTRELGYSESAAYRRISAMKLSREVPRASEAIRDGSMSLSAACALQSFLKNEEKITGKIYAPEQKEELFEKVKNKSRREIERLLTPQIPTILPPEEERPINEHHTEIRIILSQELINKLKRLKKHLAGHHANPSYGELIEILADQVLALHDTARTEEGSDKALSLPPISR